ncbi:hypothetical protein [Brassicibacter mesophilus]|uniref:hypothetical protein n=1 Tax=Brassicibacter mesophilus TaxID=745119 RepID=UPI003D1BA364
MAKLPKYMKLKYLGDLKFNVRIKKWGIPIIVFKAMKNFELKWHQWFLYPYFCIKFYRGFASGNNG